MVDLSQRQERWTGQAKEGKQGSQTSNRGTREGGEIRNGSGHALKGSALKKVVCISGKGQQKRGKGSHGGGGSTIKAQSIKKMSSFRRGKHRYGEKRKERNKGKELGNRHRNKSKTA